MILAIIAFLALAVVSVWTLSRFAPLHSMPMFLVVPLTLAVYLPLSIIVLVPADLLGGGLGLTDHTRLVLWRTIYWLTFVLTWAVLPSLQFYVESGYYDPIVKLQDALRSNVKYQLTLIGIGVLGLVYMGLSTGLNFTNLKALAVALSHSYALVITIWLLGHGLVNIPRETWNDQVQQKLKHLYLHANKTYDSYADALANYEDAVGKILALLPIKTQQYSEWIDDLVEDARKHALTSGLPVPRGATGNPIAPSDLNDQFLASLSKRFYREQHRATRYKADWVKLLTDAAFYEDIAAAERSDTGTLEFREHNSRLSPTNARIFFVQVRPWLMRALAGAMIVGTVVLVQSEILFGTSWSLVDILVRSSGGFLQLLITASLLGYMCICTVSALVSVRVFNLYALVHRETDPSSLLFYAMYACRLTVPLSYNFLMLNTGHTTTVFQEFLGQFINLTPLGKYFNGVLPRLIVIPMALTYFKLYQLAKDYLGYGLVDFDDDDALTTSEAEGRELVNRALTDTRFRYSLEAVRGNTGEFHDNASTDGAGPQAVLDRVADRVSSWFR